MRTKNDYIPASIPCKGGYQLIGSIVYRVPIELISIDKQRLAYQNDICQSAVDAIKSDFYEEAWEPIFIDDEYCIRDGQHRFTAAKQMGLKYMDVIMLNYENLACSSYRSEHYKNLAKHHPRKLTETEIIEIERKNISWKRSKYYTEKL